MNDFQVESSFLFEGIFFLGSMRKLAKLAKASPQELEIKENHKINTRSAMVVCLQGTEKLLRFRTQLIANLLPETVVSC